MNLVIEYKKKHGTDLGDEIGKKMIQLYNECEKLDLRKIRTGGWFGTWKSQSVSVVKVLF